MIDVAEVIKLCRKHSGMSIVALSAESSVSASTIKEIENGSRDCRIKTFEKLLEAMGYELEVLRNDE